MAVHTLGIALITRAMLGTTPISTLPLTLSVVFGVTLGTTTFVVNIAFFLSQIALLRARFERRQWLQLPSVLLFSAMIDGWMMFTAAFPIEGAAAAWTASLSANLLIAIGILMQLASNLILQPIDGAVLAASIVTDGPLLRSRSPTTSDACWRHPPSEPSVSGASTASARARSSRPSRSGGSSSFCARFSFPTPANDRIAFTHPCPERTVGPAFPTGRRADDF